MLTRREAYQLALLTFKYLPSVSNVRRPDAAARQERRKARAIFIRRDMVTAKLDGPLQLPGSPTSVTASDVSAIARTTAPFTFKLSSGKVSTPSGKAQAAVIVSPQ